MEQKQKQKEKQQNKQKNKQRNINNSIYEQILISNLQPTDSLKVDCIQSLHEQLSGFQVFIFDLNSFSDLLSVGSVGIWFYILEPTKTVVSISYLTVQMFRDLNLKSFLRGCAHCFYNIKKFLHYFRSKLQFNVNISISSFCKLQSGILKEPYFERSSSNVELWS